eukprot:jgi/Tetstr1/453206/TSEL_040223.t1
MGVGEDPVGEDGMDIHAPAWPPADVEAADEGVIRKGDPGDFYMKVIAKKFRGVVEAMAAAQEHPPVDAEMLKQMGVIGQIEEDLAKSVLDGDEDGELSPTARRAFNTTRLAEAKQNTGCHGMCQEARVKAIMTEKELASPAVVRSVSQLAVLGHMYKRLQGAAWFVTRWGLQNVVTEEDGPERKAQPGQRGANAPRPGQRGANARRPGQRGANASGMGGAAVATE